MALPFALLLSLAAPSAAACSMPPALEKRVCGDADLAKLDAELAEKERAVAAATARATTWAARSASFRAWLATAEWADEPYDKEHLASEIEGRIRELDMELARAKTLRTKVGADAILGATCLTTWLSPACKVGSAGLLRSGDTTILYQLMEGSSEEEGVGMGVMLWDASAPGEPKLIGWSMEGVYYQAPRFNEETRLLWVPGTMAGTGSGNADLLFQKRSGGWTEIETATWRDDLDRRLPKGIGAWKGVDYDFMGLGAETELWRNEDANCCPTGGRAYLEFELKGDAIVLKDIQAQLGGPKEEWKHF